MKSSGNVSAPSSKVMKSAAFFVVKVVLPRILGTKLARYASPTATVVSCMLLVSLGVNQIRFDGVAESSSAMSSSSVSGGGGGPRGARGGGVAEAGEEK